MTKQELEQLIKEQEEYIQQLEEMLGCAAPKSYCDSCSCGKKEALSGESGTTDSGV